MLALLSSITTAIRAEKILLRKGINVEVIRTSELSKEGCGYALKFKKEHLGAVKDAVRSVSAEIKAIYDDDDGGR